MRIPYLDLNSICPLSPNLSLVVLVGLPHLRASYDRSLRSQGRIRSNLSGCSVQEQTFVRQTLQRLLFLSLHPFRSATTFYVLSLKYRFRVRFLNSLPNIFNFDQIWPWVFIDKLFTHYTTKNLIRSDQDLFRKPILVVFYLLNLKFSELTENIQRNKAFVRYSVCNSYSISDVLTPNTLRLEDLMYGVETVE